MRSRLSRVAALAVALVFACNVGLAHAAVDKREMQAREAFGAGRYQDELDPSPSLTLDPMGNATLAFATWLTGEQFNVFTTQAAWNQPWSAPLVMETDNAAHDDSLGEFEWETFPTVHSDGAGDVMLSWRKRVGPRFDVWARQYTIAGGWSTPTLLETDNTVSAWDPVQAVGTNGTAEVAWYCDLTFPIWANIFR
jgi:hypothetical protein